MKHDVGAGSAVGRGGRGGGGEEEGEGGEGERKCGGGVGGRTSSIPYREMPHWASSSQWQRELTQPPTLLIQVPI